VTAPQSLSPAVVAAVLAAALLHAVWNAIAHQTPDRLVGFAMMGVADVLGGGALVLVGGFPSAAAWPYVVASAAVHVGYNLLLLAGYQLGEFSQVYPLARGSAPLLVTLFALLVLDRELPPLQLAGIAAVCAGLIGLVLLGGRPGRAELPAVGVAFATGLCIAGYTVIDGIGVGLGPLTAYMGWMFLLQGPAIPVLAVLRRRGRLLVALRGSALRGLTGGTISLVAYGIVLWAQTSGALAPIAALRESSIVFGALIGAVFLGERLGHRRAGAAVVVVLGVIALATPTHLI
jgi:drug/metabolite transporter (DMT)-like permease